MTEDREKALQLLFQQILMEMQQSHNRFMERCLEQSNFTVEFLQALQQHVKMVAVSADKVSSLGDFTEELPLENMQERRKEAVAAMKRLFESRVLSIGKIGQILGLSRPTALRIIQGEIFPDKATIRKVETFLQFFSAEELQRLFLPISSERPQ